MGFFEEEEEEGVNCFLWVFLPASEIRDTLYTRLLVAKRGLTNYPYVKKSFKKTIPIDPAILAAIIS